MLEYSVFFLHHFVWLASTYFTYFQQQKYTIPSFSSLLVFTLQQQQIHLFPLENFTYFGYIILVDVRMETSSH